MQSGEWNVRTLIGIALLGLALLVSAALITTVAGMFNTADAAGPPVVDVTMEQALGPAAAVHEMAVRGLAEKKRPADDPAARGTKSKTTLVYYGRARTPLIARREPVSSRSSHPAARSPDRCTSRSLPSASPG